MDMVGMTIKTCLNCILTHTVPSQSEGVFWCAVFSRFVVVFRLRRAGVFHLRCAGMLCLRGACVSFEGCMCFIGGVQVCFV